MKNFFISVFSFLLLVFLFLITRVNKENLDYKSKFPMISASDILKDNKTKLIAIVSSSCPGSVNTMPKLRKLLDTISKDSIKTIIIADELYGDNLDDSLSVFLKKYDIKESVYLMDITKYPKNGGLFNNKKRYQDFMKEICNTCDDCLFGYVNYIILKNGKYIKSVPELSNDDIHFLKNNP